MTDKYEKIRRALAAGDKQPWRSWVAACDPDTIRDLLEERDELVQDISGYARFASDIGAENVDLREAVERLLAWSFWGSGGQAAEDAAYARAVLAGVEAAEHTKREK